MAAKKGTGFVNFQNYLNANKNNQLGNTIGTGLNRDTQNVKTDLSNQQNDFNQSADKQNLNQFADYRNQTVQNPLTVTPDAVNKFQTFREGNYTGPNTLEDTGKLQNNASNLFQQGQNFNTTGGKQQLLSQYVGKNSPQYTQGQKNFDSMLIQNNPALFSGLRQTLGIRDTVNRGINQAESKAKTVAANNRSFANETKNLLGLDANGNIIGNAGDGTALQGNGAIQNTFNDVYNRFQTNLAAHNKNFQDAQRQSFNLNNLTPAQRAAFGLQPGNTIYTGGSDLGSFLKNTGGFTESNKPTLTSTASSDDVAKLNALSQLAGVAPNLITQDTSLGTYDPATDLGFSTNKDSILAKSKQNEAAYNTDLNNKNYNSIYTQATPGSLQDSYNTSKAAYLNYLANKAHYDQFYSASDNQRLVDQYIKDQAAMNALNQKYGKTNI